MGNLTGKRIDLTYDGLIKTSDEQPINGTLKGLQDGVGNSLPVEVSINGMEYYGTQDFSNSNIVGIDFTGFYGSFSDNNNQPLAGGNQVQQVQITESKISNGISIASNQININNTGTYRLSANLHVTSLASNASNIIVWLAVNGTPYLNTAVYTTLHGRLGSGLPSNNNVLISFLDTLSTGDRIEIFCSTDTQGIALESYPAVGAIPQVPSVNININQV